MVESGSRKAEAFAGRITSTHPRVARRPWLWSFTHDGSSCLVFLLSFISALKTLVLLVVPF
jgi:hypothetical protein